MSDLTLTAQGDREAVIARTFAAPAAAVYDALTDAAAVPRWLLGPPGWSMPECRVDARPGGRFRYRWEKPGEPGMSLSGAYREAARPHRLVHTERFDPDWTNGETVVTTELTESGGRTRFRAVIAYPTREARDGALASDMKAGVAASYDRLEALLLGQAVQA